MGMGWDQPTDSIAIGMFFWSYCRIASLRHILLSCLIRIVLVKKRHVWHVAYAQNHHPCLKHLVKCSPFLG